MISFDEALSNVRKTKISDFAGSWDITEKQAKEFIAENKRMWRRGKS
jgi:phage antirepressor YoqD-like protein